MADIKDRAREYIAKHSEYNEVFGQTFVAVDTLTAMVDFAEQETKELKADNDARKFAMVMSEKVEKQLREENEELKETVTKMNNVITETFSNLSKAKEIITELLKYTDTEAVEMIKEAKQFITDSEVEK